MNLCRELITNAPESVDYFINENAALLFVYSMASATVQAYGVRDGTMQVAEIVNPHL